MARICGLVFVLATAFLLNDAYPADSPAAASGSIQALQIRPHLLSSSGTHVSIDDLRVVPQMRRVYEFRLRPGTFGAGLNPHHTLQALMLDGEGAQADVAAWMHKASTRLTPMIRSASRPGLQVTPVDTRMGQIFPRVVRPSMTRINIPPRLGTSDYFIDQQGRMVLLAMFDRPCRIQGTWEVGDNRFVADVEVPQAGLYALTVVDDEAGKHRIVVGPAAPATLDVVTVLEI
jgi:hypothetical protein